VFISVVYWTDATNGKARRIIYGLRCQRDDAPLEPRLGCLTGTCSFCQVFRRLLAACRLEMNCPFPESRRTILSSFLVILFSFRFENAKNIYHWLLANGYWLFD